MPMTARATSARETFRDLHRSGTFVLPNPWDVGSARLLEAAGHPAVATTSAGFAATLGRADQQLTAEELVAHVASLVEAVDVPVAVDAEDGYGATPDAVAETVRAIAATGAAGVSIEDWHAGEGRIRPLPEAVDRLAAAVESADGMVVTGRCEHHLYGAGSLEQTLERLTAYAEAGAECVYAPGLVDAEDVAAVVSTAEAVGASVNVLLVEDGPTVEQLRALGVRRLSTGSRLAWAAYGSALDLAERLAAGGGVAVGTPGVASGVRGAAFTR